MNGFDSLLQTRSKAVVYFSVIVNYIEPGSRKSIQLDAASVNGRKGQGK